MTRPQFGDLGLEEDQQGRPPGLDRLGSVVSWDVHVGAPAVEGIEPGAVLVAAAAQSGRDQQPTQFFLGDPAGNTKPEQATTAATAITKYWVVDQPVLRRFASCNFLSAARARSHVQGAS